MGGPGSGRKKGSKNKNGTSNPLLTKIKKAKAGNAKEKLYLSQSLSDRHKLIQDMVMSLPKGARSLSSIQNEVQKHFGVHAGTDMSEKLIRGLASVHPSKVDHSFTLGLGEVIIK